ncbi:MAG: DUF917 domain-containing protein [Chloroflexota bacterium]
MRLLDEQQIADIATGSAVLGTGGGGDPYLGKLAAIQAVREFGALELAELDDLDDDVLVVFPFAIGSPVPFLERITMTDELIAAYRALERYLGRPIGAVMSIEIGGINSVLPIAVGRRLGLPVIDGDCMGRAYPEIQLVSLTLFGHPASPLAVADEHGNVALFETVSNAWAERLARPVAVEMGAIAGGVGYPVTVRDLRRAGLLGTVSLAERIGAAIRTARSGGSGGDGGAGPVAACLRASGGARVFSGRIVDVRRRTERGWALGETRIAGVDEFAGRELEIRFQNEHLVALEDGEALVSVPDLIAILDTERGDPITTENLRYGFRVTVIAIPSHPLWRTPEGLALGGPRHFGYDIEFRPVEERFAVAGA